MPEASVPVHAFFAAIYGAFFPGDAGAAGALHDAVRQALAEEQHAGLAVILMDYVAGDLELQWVSEDEGREGGPSFAMPFADSGDLDLAALAREHPEIYAEAFQVAVARLAYRERAAYDAYFALVLAAFEARFGPDSAPLRQAPAP